MKVEIICDRPKEFEMLQEALGFENVELVVPKKYNKEEYLALT